MLVKAEVLLEESGLRKCLVGCGESTAAHVLRLDLAHKWISCATWQRHCQMVVTIINTNTLREDVASIVTSAESRLETGTPCHNRGQSMPKKRPCADLCHFP